MLRWKIAQWFELRWWKNYLQAKNEGEYLSWKRNYWKEILKKVPEVLHYRTVCDLGCGPAGVFIALPQNRVTAVDPLVEEYERQIPFFQQQQRMQKKPRLP